MKNWNLEPEKIALVVESNRAVLNTRATPEVLAVLRSLEGKRAWLKGGGLQVEPTGRNIEILSSLPNVVVVRPESEPTPEVSSFEDGSSFRFLTKPYPHQLRALSKMKGRNAFGLFMEQGTGKTKTLIDWASKLWHEGKISGAIVVSKKGVHRQWIESEIPRHCSAPFLGAFWPLKKLEGAMMERGALKWLAINYEGLKTIPGFALVNQFATAHAGRLLIIADESQEIKNPRSKRWIALNALNKFSSHRALATGTPIAKDLTDEWSQLKWLDENILGIRYVTAFRAEYCVMGGFQGKAVIYHKNLDSFKRKVDPFTFRATKEEIGILPKQYSDWHFDLLPKQIQLIRELRREIQIQLENGAVIDAVNGAVSLSKFQQISNGFVIDEDKKVHRLMPIDQNPRILAALDWLDAIEGKAVIWARFREDMAMLSEALAEGGHSFVQYHGGISDADRSEAVKSFMDPKGARVFLANPQSAGVGLNLQGLCNNALYYSNSFNAIDRWQSEDRIHRIGTVGAVTYTDLIANKSVDKHIVRNLTRKKGISDSALQANELLTDFVQDTD